MTRICLHACILYCLTSLSLLCMTQFIILNSLFSIFDPRHCAIVCNLCFTMCRRGSFIIANVKMTDNGVTIIDSPSRIGTIILICKCI